jgi:HK97 family phage major capsid protein
MKVLKFFEDGFISKENAKKADFGLSELTAGGLLNPTQQDKFFEMVINYPALIGSVRRVLMPAPQYEIAKIGFGSRAFHVTTSGVGLTQSQRSKPTTDKISLTSKKIMAQFNMPYEVFEDNIAKGTLEGTLLKLFADRLATDTEELGLLGDPASGDADLAAFTGYLKRMTSHIVNATGTGIHEDTFNNAILALPAKYRRDISGFRFFLSPNAKQTWKNRITSRQTALGDAALQGMIDVAAHGVPLVGVPLMPSGIGMFTRPDNLIMGVQREVMMEADRDKENQIIKFIFSARVDFQIEEEDMTVKFTNLGA